MKTQVKNFPAHWRRLQPGNSSYQRDAKSCWQLGWATNLEMEEMEEGREELHSSSGWSTERTQKNFTNVWLKHVRLLRDSVTGLRLFLQWTWCPSDHMPELAPAASSSLEHTNVGGGCVGGVRMWRLIISTHLDSNQSASFMSMNAKFHLNTVCLHDCILFLLMFHTASILGEIWLVSWFHINGVYLFIIILLFIYSNAYSCFCLRTIIFGYTICIFSLTKTKQTKIIVWSVKRNLHLIRKQGDSWITPSGGIWIWFEHHQGKMFQT